MYMYLATHNADGLIENPDERYISLISLMYFLHVRDLKTTVERMNIPYHVQ